VIRHNDKSQRFRMVLLTSDCLDDNAPELKVCEQRLAPVRRRSDEIDLVLDAAAAVPKRSRASHGILGAQHMLDLAMLHFVREVPIVGG